MNISNLLRDIACISFNSLLLKLTIAILLSNV